MKEASKCCKWTFQSSDCTAIIVQNYCLQLLQSIT